MKATILDTVTGLKKSVDGPRSFEWAVNGWSCDCNRDLWDVTNHEDECDGYGTRSFLGNDDLVTCHDCGGTGYVDISL